MMDKKTSPIRELQEMLKSNEPKKKLLEGYISEEDFDTLDGGEMPEEDFPLDGMQGGSGDELAQEQGILPIKNEIDQIRQIALKTIARLAENPVSESYQMMKKIWMMCDKAIESALNPDEGNKKNTGF